MEQKPVKYAVKPKIKDLKLNVLLDVTKAINNNASTQQLLEKFEHFLRDQLNIEKLALFSYDTDWTCLLAYGLKEGELEKINLSDDLSQLKDITSVLSLHKPHLNAFDVIIPVYHKSIPLAYLLIGDLYEDEIALSPTIKHLPFIQTLTNIIIVAIENKKLAKEKIRQEGVKKELELAWQMQSLLFPSELPDNNRLQIAAYYQPHQQVGGDYYDYIRLNENEIVFCMADVSGKGVSAALLMANFQANLRALVGYKTSLADLIKELNAKVMSNAKGEKFITLFIARYNLVTRMLNYVNAGHNPPLLYVGNAVNILNIGSTGLGMFDELPRIREGIVTIAPGSTLVCYTDGVVETENEGGNFFGVEKLKELISDNSALNMKELNEAIINNLEDFKGQAPYADDIAVLSCSFF